MNACVHASRALLKMPAAAGRPELQGDACGDTDDRLQHSTFRDVTPHSFTTQSRPATSVRAATSDVRRPTKPPLPVPALQPIRREPARGRTPVRGSCGGSAQEEAGDALRTGSPAGIQAAWDGPESDNGRCMLAHVEVRSTMSSQHHASVVTCHCTTNTWSVLLAALLVR